MCVWRDTLILWDPSRTRLAIRLCFTWPIHLQMNNVQIVKFTRLIHVCVRRDRLHLSDYHELLATMSLAARGILQICARLEISRKVYETHPRVCATWPIHMCVWRDPSMMCDASRSYKTENTQNLCIDVCFVYLHNLIRILSVLICVLSMYTICVLSILYDLDASFVYCLFICVLSIYLCIVYLHNLRIVYLLVYCLLICVLSVYTICVLSIFYDLDASFVYCLFICVLSIVYSLRVKSNHSRGEVGGWGRVPFSKKLMSPTPRRTW